MTQPGVPLAESAALPTPPSRVVDREHRGWMLTRGPDGSDTYSDVYTEHHDEYLSPDELATREGPLRPVLPITDADAAELDQALEMAGRKAVYSLAVAVYRTLGRLRADAGGMERPSESMETSWRQIRAGRPGSWEAHQLTQVALWAGDDKPARVHEQACTAMTEMLYRWCTDPHRFTELAETLAAVVSGYADEHGGWATVADQWLQPGGLDQEGLHLTYGLFYSCGQHFDYEVLG